MAFSILEAAQGLVSNEIISKASTFLGESEGGVSKAISGVIPTIFSGLINKVSTGEGASQVATLASEQYQAGAQDNLGNFFGGADSSDLLQKGAGVINSIFGSQTEGLSSLLSNFSGIKASSSSSLLSMAAPMILGLLGKHAAAQQLNSGGIATLLTSQKDTVNHAIPSGLNLSGVLGTATASIKHAAPATPHLTEELVQEEGGPSRWLVPLFLLALIAAGAYYLFGTSGKSTEEAVTVIDTVKTESPVKMTEPVRESLKVKLPDGVELDAYKGGIEDRLVNFLKSDYKKLGADSLKKIWFDFDNLNFKTASAEITPESQKQIDNIAAILKAFPDTKLKIGGYTDKTGDEATNKKLSADRANSVKAALVKAGKAAQLTGADGYGSDFAKFPATAPESDRVTDRHVSVSVRL